jgi:hypothetical protein
MAGPMMKRSLGQNNFFFTFFTFEKDTTNYRGTLVENVKKVKNQPTLLFSSSSISHDMDAYNRIYENIKKF